MFTGLVEEVGSVISIRAREPGAQLEIVAPLIAENIHIGDSVAVNGCCLTLSAHRADQLTFDLLGETLARTNLKMLKRDSSVNLERALRTDGRLARRASSASSKQEATIGWPLSYPPSLRVISLARDRLPLMASA